MLKDKLETTRKNKKDDPMEKGKFFSNQMTKDLRAVEMLLLDLAKNTSVDEATKVTNIQYFSEQLPKLRKYRDQFDDVSVGKPIKESDEVVPLETIIKAAEEARTDVKNRLNGISGMLAGFEKLARSKARAEAKAKAKAMNAPPKVS